MEYFVNSIQMKKIDNNTINKTGIPSIVLMERAALITAEYIKDNSYLHDSILVICGMGNNGADGLAVARIMFLWGYKNMEVIFLGQKNKATREWLTQYEILKNLGIKVYSADDCSQYEFYEYIKYKDVNLIVDAIFGIGLTREIKGIYKDAIDAVNDKKVSVVSVDMPSGVCTDDGKILGTAIKASATVTFGRKKVGQICYPGAEYCGKLILGDIGFSPNEVLDAGYDAFSYTIDDINNLIKERSVNSHKGDFGKVLVIAGSSNMSGAAFFCAKAAYRMGSGIVKIHTVLSNKNCMMQLVPEAVFSFYDEKNYSEELLLEDCKWADSIAVGPGLGREEHILKILNIVLKKTRKTIVIDADALRVMSDNTELYKYLKNRAVVTPHMGEMSSLTGKSIEELLVNPAKEAVLFANNNDCICVLKGARTIVAAPGNNVYYINTSGCNALATAGSGDVLTGIIASLLNQCDTIEYAAQTGVFLHGIAGERAGAKRGNRSVTAIDVLDETGIW